MNITITFTPQQFIAAPEFANKAVELYAIAESLFGAVVMDIAEAPLSEAELMDRDIEAIRSGIMPIAYRLTADDLAAMSREMWGEEQYNHRWMR